MDEQQITGEWSAEKWREEYLALAKELERMRVVIDTYARVMKAAQKEIRGLKNER